MAHGACRTLHDTCRMGTLHWLRSNTCLPQNTTYAGLGTAVFDAVSGDPRLREATSLTNHRENYICLYVNMRMARK